MRSTVKVLSVVAALAMAVGLSACEEQEGPQTPTDGATASASADKDADSSSDPTASEDEKDSKKDEKGKKDDKDEKDKKDKKKDSKGGETTKSGSKIQDINTVTFRDDEIGLTQTCDKVVEDYAAPKYKQGKSDETVYLLHCTLDFDGDVGYSSGVAHTTSLQDKKDSSLKADEYGSLLANDLKADGLETFDIVEDSGVPSVEGWFAFVSLGKSTTLKPFSDGSTNIVYDRGEGENTRTGKHYGPYSDTQELVLK